jgi:uncharacterized protein (TIGR03083 family)
MQIAPVYDAGTFLTIEGSPGDQLEPLVRQRRRMETILGSLTDDQWASPSRCEGWSVRDVIAHLNGTNLFWAASIGAGAAGSPTKFLAEFDPVATPAQMVDATRAVAPEETLRQFVDSNRSLFAAVEQLDEHGWNAVAESPAGHVSIRLVAHHALWDAWVHERDITVPLGLDQDAEPDEIESCVRYAAALGPTLAFASGNDRRGSLAVETSDPSLHYVVDVGPTIEVHRRPAPAGALTIEGPAVEVIDRLSIRAPLGQPVPEASRWLLGGLAEAFDTRLDFA